MQALAEPRNSTDPDIPMAQRRKSRTLAQWLASCENREEAIYTAHTESALSMSAIARESGLSVSRVNRLIARVEGTKDKACPSEFHDAVSLNALLVLIGEPRVGLRPGRVEPRALKRRTNQFSLLTKPRQHARMEVRDHGHAEEAVLM